MPTTGQLRYLLNFQARQNDGSDGFGGTVTGPYETVFTAAAALSPLRGTETVMSDRLQGVQPYVCTIRSTTDSRQVTAAWQAVDARTGTVYQIKSPASDPDGKNAWLDMLVSVGVPS